MSRLKLSFVVTCAVFLVSCKKYDDKEIRKLLNSNDPENLIIGSFEAGESGKKDFIPLLLRNADDPRMCTHIRFKGFSVYQEKMGALKKILKASPPTKLTYRPDSTIIKFYSKVATLAE